MFNDHFEVFLADTYESKKIHYSIRYQVYCAEMGFENKEDFPDEQEFDEYDKYSAHFIVRHKDSGCWVAAMRLIDNKKDLPMETHCTLHEEILRSPFKKSVELSRLCVLSTMRRSTAGKDNLKRKLEKEGKSLQNKVKGTNNSRRVNQSIIWGLLNAASEYCYINKIPNWYFMTSAALQKVLTKGGFHMSLIGDACEFRGERFPFKKDAHDAYHHEVWRQKFVNGTAYKKCSEFIEEEDYILQVA